MAVLASLRRDALRGGLLVGAVSLFCNLGALAVPIYNMQIFNRVMTTHNMHTLSGLTLGLAVAVAGYLALDRLRLVIMAALGDCLASRIATPMMAAVQAAWPRGPDPVQAIRDAETLRSFVGSPLLAAPFDLAWTPVLLFVLLAMGWGYGLVAAVSVILLAALNLLGDAASRRHLQASNVSAAHALREVASAARSAEAVVAMGMLPALSRRWALWGDQAAHAEIRALLRSRGFTAATRALRSAMTGATVATGLVLVLNGYASSGTLVAANMILARMLMPFEQFAGTLRQWADALAAWRRVSHLLREPVPVRYAFALPRPAGSLSVERLVFFPPGADRAILRGISFAAGAGEIVGVAGPSASGKSTLLKSIMGMIEPTTGGVFLDGHSTFLWNRADFACHVGYVPQGLALGEGTIAQIIARGAAEPDLRAVIAAAKRAGIHAAIAGLANGYATRVNSGGFVLSAGQRQRLAIARALFSNPRLLVLDEPAAFLDAAGEMSLLRLLAALREEGVGALVSAHRPSLLQAADKLLVLQDGLAVQFGPAAEVMAQMAHPSVRLLRAVSS